MRNTDDLDAVNSLLRLLLQCAAVCRTIIHQQVDGAINSSHQGASGEECEWYSRIVALFRAKAPYGDSGEFVDLVFMRYYWQDTTDGRVDVHGNTQFPLLRWSDASKDEGAWGLSDIACILRVVHVIRTWSDKGDFQINCDAPV